jgi:hypothetical protein
MKIKIVVTNKEKGTNEAIYKALTDANGKATQHTITSSKDIIELAAKWEKWTLDIVGLKKNLHGAVVKMRSGSQLPASYKGTRRVTYVTIERGPTCWWLTGVQTDDAWNDAGKTQLILTEAQDSAAIANLRTQYTVHQTVK